MVSFGTAYADREIGAPGNANLLIGRSYKKNHIKSQATKPPLFSRRPESKYAGKKAENVSAFAAPLKTLFWHFC